MTVTRDVTGSVTAVLALHGAEQGDQTTLELHGPLDPLLLDAALARVAVDRPELREVHPRIERHGPGHHSLELAAPYPVGVLADMLTAAARAPGPAGGPTRRWSVTDLPEPLALTPLQRELLTGAAHRPHQQVGQLSWRWHGPLDTARFTAAWRRVFDHEAVLRAAFVWDPQPRVALHARAHPDVVRHAYGTLTRQALMDQERARGFDLSRPGLLRFALLDGAPQQAPPGHVPPTDVVLTYHRGLLDSGSVGLLAREFYRGYLAEAPSRGGERRPDLRDYRRWLDAQDPAPARDFWTRTGGDLTPGLPRANPGTLTGRDGTGRCQVRLTRTETTRLAEWAAQWGATESSALQAVWAMILFRSDIAARGPAPVSFNVSVSGRGIPMEGIAYVPGPFDNPLPMALEVDPAGTVPALLRAVRDRYLGMAEHEWVTAGQVREWLGYDADAAPAETLISFEHRLSPLKGLSPELAAQGVEVADVDPAGGGTAFAMSVVARFDSRGGLLLTAVHDRGRLRDDHARGMLAHSARLLRELPDGVEHSTTVAEALGCLAGADVPRLHEHPAGQDTQRLVWLREAARPGAGAVCLIAPPGAPDRSHAALARWYQGPEAVTVLRVDPARVPGAAAALRPLLAAGGRLVLGGFSGAGALACQLARHVAAHGGRAPLVVLGAGGDGRDGRDGGDGRVHDLARALAAAARQA
ncbi:condensation domain-containing protein [Streptomyces sp. NPDC054866]